MTHKAKASFAAALASASAAFAQIPTSTISSQTSYIEPTAAGWSAVPLITVGDTVTNSGSGGGTYAMVGIPDGLGAYSSGSTVTILMNHELGNTVGNTRAHGSVGSFVSQWTLDKNTLNITSGQDLIQSGSNVFTWNGSAYAAGTTAFARLCSADLPALSAVYNSGSNLGYNGRIFMNGEETGAEGRAFAFVATGSDAGKAYQLPDLGRFSWENSVANPHTGNKTVVVGTDDSTPGQVYVYIGDKKTTGTGTAVEQAGLTGGSLYGIKVTNGGANYSGGAVPLENAGAINGTFVATSVSANSANTTTAGAALQTASNAAGITNFARPEDAQWLDSDTLLFVTTGADPDAGGAAIHQSAKLYRLDFDADFLSGTVSMVLDRTQLDLAGFPANTAMFDNMTVGLDGKVYIQEDPGNNAYIAKVWQVDLSNPTAAVQIFESDRDRFGPAVAPFNVDEEHSGIIDVTNLFNGVEGDAASWYIPGTKLFLADTQAHYGIGTGGLIEGGQLQLLIDSSSAIPEPASFAALAGLAGLGLAASRRRRA